MAFPGWVCACLGLGGGNLCRLDAHPVWPFLMCWAISGFVAGWIIGVAMGPMVESAIARLLK